MTAFFGLLLYIGGSDPAGPSALSEGLGALVVVFSLLVLALLGFWLIRDVVLGVATSVQKLRDEHELAEHGGAEEGAPPSAMVSPVSSRELLSRQGSTLQSDVAAGPGDDAVDAVRPPSVVAAAADPVAAPAPAAAPVDDVAQLVAAATAAVERRPLGDARRPRGPRGLPPVKHRRVSDGSDVVNFVDDEHVDDRQ